MECINENTESQDTAFKLVDLTPKKSLTLSKKPKRDLAMVQDRLEGATYKELAKRYGIANASVSYILNKTEMKAILQDTLNHLASFAPIVVRNYRLLLNSDKESIRLKATDNLAKILGLTPSHAPSQINNLYIQQNNLGMISDSMKEFISKMAGQDDFIDAEFSAIIDD